MTNAELVHSIIKTTPDDHDHWLQLRSKVLTSTEVSALFGLSPYMTEFELWHTKKKEEIVVLDQNERMFWGDRLEYVIAESICEKNEFAGKPLKDFWRSADIKLGASFDWMIETDEGMGLLEIKNVDGLVFRDKWRKDEDGNILAPPHIELQCQAQLAVAQMDFMYIGALVGGNKLEVLKRVRNEKIIDAICKKTQEFWDSIDRNEPPEIDFEKDADYIFKLFKYAEPKKILEIDGQKEIYHLATNYKEAADIEKNAISKKKAAKAEILTIINDYEKVKHPDFTISASVSKRGVRNFRINWRD